MESPLIADLDKLVARLVLGYLDKQNLVKAFKQFCKNSQYLKDEYESYKKGYKFFDISAGLRSIVYDYYESLQTLDDFAKKCPRNSIAAQALLANDLKRKVEILLKLVPDGLKQIERRDAGQRERKRKHSSEIETSTPENPKPKKRRKSYCINPFNTSQSPIALENSLKGKEQQQSSDSSSDSSSSSSQGSSPVKNDSINVASQTLGTSDTLKPDNLSVNKSQLNRTGLKGSYVCRFQENFTDFCLQDMKIPKKLADNINKIINTTRNEPGTSADANNSENLHDKLVDDALNDILNLTANDPDVTNVVHEAAGIAICQTAMSNPQSIIDFETEIPVFGESSPFDSMPPIEPAKPCEFPERPVIENENNVEVGNEVEVETEDRNQNESANQEQNPKTTVENDTPTSQIQVTSTTTPTKQDDEETAEPEPDPEPDQEPETQEQEKVQEEVPYRQRLRARKPSKFAITKKARRKKSEKINIISNVPYTGPAPNVEFIPQEPQPSVAEPVMFQPFEFGAQPGQIVINGQSYTITSIPVVIDPSQPLVFKSPYKCPTEVTLIDPSQLQNFQNLNPNQLFIQNNPEFLTTAEVIEISDCQENIVEPAVEQNKSTPSAPKMMSEYLESKSKSTPRRKASHVRILDFNWTPSRRMGDKSKRMSTIKEFTTPQSSGIRMQTPSSAPPTVNLGVFEKRKIFSGNLQLETIDDDESNSTSISDTPKVSKDPKKCARILSHTNEELEKESEAKEKKTAMSVDEWNKMRQMSSSSNFDQHLRSVYREALEKVGPQKKKRVVNNANKKKKTPKKRGKKVEQAEKKEDNDKSHETSKELEDSEDDTPIKDRINASPKKKRKTPHKLAKVVEPKKRARKPRKSEVKKVVIEKSEEKSEKDERESKSFEENENADESLQEISFVSGNTTGDKVENEIECETFEEPVKENKEIVPETKEPEKVEPEQNIEVFKEPFKKRKSFEQHKVDAEPKKPEEIENKPEEIENKPAEPKISENSQFNMAALLDTPFKPSTDDLPKTPRFLAPDTHNTPMLKFIKMGNSSSLSLMKGGDIQTPAFAITPGNNETPAKSDVSPHTGSEGYNRKTDYSSCSSYYKPDESEDIKNLESMLESERMNRKEIERVPSQPPTEILEYRDSSRHQNESSDSDSDSDSSSSSSCSTCSTCSSSSSASTQKTPHKTPHKTPAKSCSKTPGKMNKSCSKTPYKTPYKTPAKNFSLLTPGRLGLELTPSPVTKDVLLSAPSQSPLIKQILQQQNSDKKNVMAVNLYPAPPRPLEEIRLRTVQFFKNEEKSGTKAQKKTSFYNRVMKGTGAETAKPSTSKVTKKSPIKPPEAKQSYILKKERILQIHDNAPERSKPTPQLLIDNINSKASKRKNPTPRKVIMLPTTSTNPAGKKSAVPKSGKSPGKSSSKKTQVSSIPKLPLDDSDNAVNIPFNVPVPDEEESIENIAKHIESTANSTDSGNTFQKTLMQQGFDRETATMLHRTFVDLETSERGKDDVGRKVGAENVKKEAGKVTKEEKRSEVVEEFCESAKQSEEKHEISTQDANKSKGQPEELSKNDVKKCESNKSVDKPDRIADKDSKSTKDPQKPFTKPAKPDKPTRSSSEREKSKEREREKSKEREREKSKEREKEKGGTKGTNQSTKAAKKFYKTVEDLFEGSVKKTNSSEIAGEGEDKEAQQGESKKQIESQKTDKRPKKPKKSDSFDEKKEENVQKIGHQPVSHQDVSEKVVSSNTKTLENTLKSPVADEFDANDKNLEKLKSTPLKTPFSYPAELDLSEMSIEASPAIDSKITQKSPATSLFHKSLNLSEISPIVPVESSTKIPPMLEKLELTDKSLEKSASSKTTTTTDTSGFMDKSSDRSGSDSGSDEEIEFSMMSFSERRNKNCFFKMTYDENKSLNVQQNLKTVNSSFFQSNDSGKLNSSFIVEGRKVTLTDTETFEIFSMSPKNSSNSSSFSQRKTSKKSPTKSRKDKEKERDKSSNSKNVVPDDGKKDTQKSVNDVKFKVNIVHKKRPEEIQTEKKSKKKEKERDREKEKASKRESSKEKEKPEMSTNSNTKSSAPVSNLKINIDDVLSQIHGN